MAMSGIMQQSLVGDIISFPFAVVKFIVTAIVKILLFPLYVLKFIITLPIKIFPALKPVFYLDNVTHSFRFLWCGFKTLFFVASFLLIAVLIPVYLIALFASNKALASIYPFDLLKSLLLMAGSFALTEALLFLLVALGLLLTFTLALTFITIYSPLQVIIEYLDAITSSRIVLVMMFTVTVFIFGMLYLLLQLLA